MILHVDMDAFYASVEERDDPKLVGRPVIVGGPAAARGVVSAANYRARTFGVHSAMPMSTALRLCPEAIVRPVRMGHYAEISRQIQTIFERYTPLIEPLSLDEAFLDVTGSQGLFGPPDEIGWKIKTDIRRELRLVASVGVAPSKFVAKIASDFRKPDGFVVVAPDEVPNFLEPLPVTRIWGVGRAAGQELERLGVRTIGDLRTRNRDELVAHFGQSGERYWELSHGIDARVVTPDRQAKSISNETTFAADIDNLETLRTWTCELCEQVARRLRQSGLWGRTVELKVRLANFQTSSRSKTLPAPTQTTHDLWQAAEALLAARLPGKCPPIRLIGVGVTNLSSDVGPEQQTIFEDREDRRKHQRLDVTLDEIQTRFGQRAVTRANSPRRRRPS